MKRSKQCPKCQSLRIGHLAEQLDIDDSIKDTTEKPYLTRLARKPAARVVGYQGEEFDSGWILGEGMVKPLVGALEAYVCTDCGYYETFVKAPDNVEWDKLVGFTWLNAEPPSGGPFR